MTNEPLAAHFNDAQSDDRNQRLTNKTFHTLLGLTDDGELRPPPAEPFATIVNVVARGNEADSEDATP